MNKYPVSAPRDRKAEAIEFLKITATSIILVVILLAMIFGLT